MEAALQLNPAQGGRLQQLGADKRHWWGTREGADCFGGQDFARGKEIGKGVLSGFCIEVERERDGGSCVTEPPQK
jgi:hypothetical protein